VELKNAGKTIIISTHIMNLVEKICDRVGIIIKGRLVLCDKVSSILSSYPGADIEEIFFDLYSEVYSEEYI
jgi:sodium transport system ATP-binding protein